jgi:hypothetical protein
MCACLGRCQDSYRAQLAAGVGEVDIDTCVPSTVLLALMLKWMLVFEERDADTLWLLKMAPRRMYGRPPQTPTTPAAHSADIGGGHGSNNISRGRTETGAAPMVLEVTSSPTRFGGVSYTLTSQAVSDSTALQFVVK